MLLIKKANKIDGVKINWTTPMTPNFSLSHSWSLVPPKPKKMQGNPMMQGAMDIDKVQSGYSLNAQYAHVDEKNPQDPSFVIFANMESCGKLQSVFMLN